jgi:hypothetical protein
MVLWLEVQPPELELAQVLAQAQELEALRRAALRRGLVLEVYTDQLQMPLDLEPSGEPSLPGDKAPSGALSKED